MQRKAIIAGFVTTLILVIIFNKVNFGDLLLVLDDKNWMWIILSLLGVSLFTLFVDLASFGVAYKRYLAPTISYRRLLELRSIVLLVVATVPPMAIAVSFGYFYTRHHIPVKRVFGVELFVTSLDILAGVFVLTVGLLLYAGSIPSVLSGALVSLWGVVVFLFLWAALGKNQKLNTLQSQNSSFEIFKIATASEYVHYFLCRLALVGCHLIVVMTLLLLFDISLPFSHILIFSPLFVASAFLPISIGGFGGPQGLAVLLLVSIWDVASLETVLAMSLVWSSFYLLFRALVGMIFTSFFLMRREYTAIRIISVQEP